MTELTENAESPDPSGVGTERPPLDGRAIGLDLLDRFGAAAVAGLAAGFLIGGVGGRMAMLLLRLTSSDSVIGIQSDDDFTIGQVTTSSFFLVLATTLIGALLAFAYLLVRRWLPEHRRPLQAAVFFGVIGGAAVIKPGGVDFTLLDPLWLAVVLFIALPAAYGWVMAAMVEGLIARPGAYRKTRVAGIVFFVAVGFFGLFAAAIAVAGGLLILIGRQWPALATAVTHPVVTWTVRIILLLVVAVQGAELVSDVAEIL